jgi:hypothetical protein
MERLGPPMATALREPGFKERANASARMARQAADSRP